jgi:hypothetical protein
MFGKKAVRQKTRQASAVGRIPLGSRSGGPHGGRCRPVVDDTHEQLTDCARAREEDPPCWLVRLPSIRSRTNKLNR